MTKLSEIDSNCVSGFRFLHSGEGNKKLCSPFVSECEFRFRHEILSCVGPTQKKRLRACNTDYEKKTLFGKMRIFYACYRTG